MDNKQIINSTQYFNVESGSKRSSQNESLLINTYNGFSGYCSNLYYDPQDIKNIIFPLTRGGLNSQLEFKDSFISDNSSVKKL